MIQAAMASDPPWGLIALVLIVFIVYVGAFLKMK